MAIKIQGFNPSKHPLYTRWKKIKARTVGPKAKDYKRYGGRGIGMYEPWITDPVAFIEYCIALPSYDLKLEIDRIDNDGNYEPGNIRFSTRVENGLNKGNNWKCEYQGVMYNTLELSELAGLPPKLIRDRLERGWSVEKAVQLPTKGRCQEIVIEFPEEGLLFKGIAEAVRYFKVVSYATAMYRIGSGWAPEVAVRALITKEEQRSSYTPKPWSRLQVKNRPSQAKAGPTTLPLKSHPLYRKVSSIISRCTQETNCSYMDYGGRGITVFSEWLANPRLFLSYLQSLEGSDDPKKSVDRIDVNGNYEPGNLRFATAKEQANNKRNNIKILVFGEYLTIVEAISKYGLSELSQDRVRERIQKEKYTPEEAITTPLNLSVRKHSYKIPFEGRLYSLAELVRKIGKVSYPVVQYRLKKGWELIAAVTEPKGSKGV